MIYNIVSSVFARMNGVNLGLAKTVVAIADDRESAEVVAEAIRENIEFNDHVQTGRLLDSVSVTPAGRGDFNVKTVYYGPYVNAHSGFIDDAINEAILDGYSVDSMLT
jgi:hypothetical protein